MDYNFFNSRYHLNEMDKERRECLLRALDILYCEFPGINAIQLVQDYLANADNIFNTIK